MRRAQRTIRVWALSLGVAAGAAAPPAQGRDLGAADQGAPATALGPASDWRLLDGPGLHGVLRLSEDPEARRLAYGFFAFRVKGRGVFEGLYNVKEGGAKVVGMFWPDGRLNEGPAAGFLDLSADEAGTGAGRVGFIDGEPVDGVRAR